MALANSTVDDGHWGKIPVKNLSLQVREQMIAALAELPLSVPAADLAVVSLAPLATLQALAQNCHTQTNACFGEYLESVKEIIEAQDWRSYGWRAREAERRTYFRRGG